MTETCTTDENMQYLYCNVCVTTEGNNNNSGSDTFNEFCMATDCDMSIHMGDSTLEEACTCSGASVDGVDCDLCEICRDDNIDYDIETAMAKGSVADGVALMCPSSSSSGSGSSAFNSTCAVSTSSKTAAADPKIIAAIVVPIVVLVAAIGAYLYVKAKQQDQDPKKFSLVVEEGRNEKKKPIAA